MRGLYDSLLRMPRFKGRGRIENALRHGLEPKVSRVHGLLMQLDPQEWNQIELISGVLPEPQTLALMERLLGQGDACIDVGAHVGLHALIAARQVGATGQVIAIDPQPYNCERVLVNCRLNGFNQVLTVVAAAGEADGFVTLHDQKANDKTRLTLAGDGVGDVAARFETPIIRLDSLAQRHGLTRLRLLKVDVEGYEAQVLRGAAGLLMTTENVIFECLPQTEPAEAKVLADLLQTAGFVLKQVDGSPWTPGAPSIENNVWASRAQAREN